MTTTLNRKFLLASRPAGRIGPEHFEIVVEDVPEIGSGEVLVRNCYLSLDPTNRIWMSDQVQYMPPVQIGEVMRGFAVGQVIRSNDPVYPVGVLVQGLLGWQDYAVVKTGGDLPLSILPARLPMSIPTAMGLLGITGLSAYFGLLDLGTPKEGETVVVSAAAGAVGSVVGQIAKIKGCRAVGIAGTADKCAWLKDELGFDAAINYRDADWRQQLKAACPDGVDVNFENVGGEILDVVLSMMNLRGRVTICGLISSYNATEPVPGPYNFSLVLMKRLRVEGFIVSDYASRFGDAIADLSTWYSQGRIKHRETVVEGLEHAPVEINRLFDGGNTGKFVVKIADPPLSLPLPLI